jgi:hypothetical protein
VNGGVLKLCFMTVLVLVCSLCRKDSNELCLFSTATQLIPDAKTLQIADLGNDSLFADFYWLAFIQYIGDRKARIEDRNVLAPRFLDLITYLDPTFVDAYYFVAFTIGGELKHPLSAAHIIERGIEANKSDWRLPYIAGFNYYLYAHDENRAADYYEEASSMKGAPAWLAGQAKVLKAKIPSMLKEAGILEGVLAASTDLRVKNAAHKNLVAALEEVIRVSPSAKISNLIRQRLHELRSTSDATTP